MPIAILSPILVALKRPVDDEEDDEGADLEVARLEETLKVLSDARPSALRSVVDEKSRRLRTHVRQKIDEKHLDEKGLSHENLLGGYSTKK